MDYKALAKWALGRNTGLSSKAIACHLAGFDSDGAYPRDAGDFKRCEALLDEVPELRARMGEMASLNPYWAALAPRWEEVRATPDDRKHALIRAIVTDATKNDPSVIDIAPGISLRFGR